MSEGFLSFFSYPRVRWNQFQSRSHKPGRAKRHTRKFLDIQADRPHQFEPIALGDNSVTELVIERDPSVRQFVLKVDIAKASIARFDTNVGQREIVCADQADRSALHQSAQNSFGSDAAVIRVRSLQKFVEQEKQSWRFTREVEDLSQPLDFSVEPRTAFLE